VLSLQEAHTYAAENSIIYMDTSAKTGFNVKEIFVAIGTWYSLPLIIPETPYC